MVLMVLFFTEVHKSDTFYIKTFAGHRAQILALEMGGNNLFSVEKIVTNALLCMKSIHSPYSAGQRCTVRAVYSLP